MSDETQKKKLLIVDDEKYITQLLSELLESDYTVDSAADGIQAFNKIKNEKFDLMLTDINMPNLDGLQLLRLVRESHPDTVVIMMSGLATTDNVIDALNSGAAYFLKKPFKIEEIHKIIKQKLGSVSDSSKPAVSGVTNDIEALITDINYLILSNNYGNMNDIKKILPGCAELYRESLSDERVVKLLKRIKKFDDAIHIAVSSYYNMDILLSWNFRHLANIRKQIQINKINKKIGFKKELFILNPMEVIYENDD